MVFLGINMKHVGTYKKYSHNNILYLFNCLWMFLVILALYLIHNVTTHVNFRGQKLILAISMLPHIPFSLESNVVGVHTPLMKPPSSQPSIVSMFSNLMVNFQSSTSQILSSHWHNLSLHLWTASLLSSQDILLAFLLCFSFAWISSSHSFKL